MITAISMYTLSVAIHVVFVVSFLGAGAAFGIIGPLSGKYPEHGLFALRVIKEVDEKLIFPGMLVVWGTGFYQASDAGFELGDLWLTISVVLFALITLLTIFVLYPAVKVAITELEAQTEPGPPSATVQASIKKLSTFGPMIGVAMMVITFLMVAQPF
jgi:uncharacterized membrane protein